MDIHVISTSINEILQEHLEKSPVDKQLVVHINVETELTFVVDNVTYKNIHEIQDTAVRQAVQAAVDDWQNGLTSLPQVRTIRKRRKISSSIVILSPLILAFLMLVINPSYVTELSIREGPYVIYPYFPCGWLVILVFLGLIITAHIIYTLAARRTPPIDTGTYEIRLLLIFGFFIVPAICMILFAPAFLQIARNGASP